MSNPSTAATFTKALDNGSAYSITVSKSPQDYTCAFKGDSTGTVKSADVSGTLECTRNALPKTPRTVSAKVNGLTGAGLQLKLVSIDGFKNPELTAAVIPAEVIPAEVIPDEVTPDTSVPTKEVTFTTTLYTGNLYEVSVAQQPDGQNCQPTNRLWSGGQ